jgi:hypothetical protein
MRVIRLVLTVVLATLVSGCEQQSDKPYLKIQGGGFVFNYRYSAMSYGFVAKPLRPLPEGSVLEASFDIPGSTERYTSKMPAAKGKMSYAFESPRLAGVEKGKPYKVTLRLFDVDGGKEIAVLEQTYRTDKNQAELPTKAPIKDGPGYVPNPG